MGKNIFIMGSRGFTRNYGGWETLVKNLISNWENKNYKFYVYELVDTVSEQKNVIIENVHVNRLYIPKFGYSRMVFFSIKSLFAAIKYVRIENIENPIFYVLGLRIGPLFRLLHKRLKKMNIKIVINPDGLEWERDKWNYFVKKYFLFSEKTMFKSSDLVICDSIEIKKNIEQRYKNLNTKYIAYGADIDYKIAKETENLYQDFLKTNDIEKSNYYLMVGRFVPENNYLSIISEYMASMTNKTLIIVSNVEENKYYKKITKETNFLTDSRIKFVGTVYNKELLFLIRKHAYGYIHGHSVGGTNPSLLEALAITDLNLLFDVKFNREVGQDCTYYFSNGNNNLSNLINILEDNDSEKFKKLGLKCKLRVKKFYNWFLVSKLTEQSFEELFINEKEF
jgi:rhamnosyltransferase